MRVLLIEDNDLVRVTVREMLKYEGWHVEACENGIAALEKIERGIHYDLIITDYDLPEMDGVEFARRAHQLDHRRNTPIIMLTASPVEVEASAVGVHLLLKKPEDINRLVEAIKDYMPGPTKDKDIEAAISKDLSLSH